MLTHDDKFAYVSNTGSNTISGYSIGENGSISLLNSDGITATSGLGPIDADVSSDSKYFYVLDSEARNIQAFSIDSTSGALTMIGDYGELIHNAAGFACK